MKQNETGLERWLASVPAAQAVVALADLNRDAAVFVVDRDRTILHWNAAAERLLGHRAEDIVGEHCLKANRCAQCIQGCGIANHGEVRDVPIMLHTAEEQVVHVRKNGRAFFDGDGSFAGGVEILAPEVVDERAPSIGPYLGTEFHGMRSNSPAMHEVFRSVAAIGKSDAPVLINGESGTGKELMARAIHEESHRADGPFIAVNCAALVPTLLESELFGHVKGAFTGATDNRDGLLLRADGGTLFLDEVAELSPELQAKLLRVVERSCFIPVGGRNQTCVDVRLVAATHRSLPKQVELGAFREDLMYRLRVVPMTLPPLRERASDVPLLVDLFVARQNASGGRRVETVADEAMAALQAHRWPGNVRELQNAITYAFAVGRGPELRLRDLPEELRTADADTEGDRQRAPKRGSEADRIRDALVACDGHIGRAAEQLGMSRPTLWRKRRRYGIEA